MIKKVELLAPAGDLEKLKVAVNYGADAVYISGQQFGLRAKAKNFDLAQMAAGIEYAHKNNVSVYVTANIFAHNSDFEGMAEYFKSLEQINADALIISDFGVLSLAKEVVPDLEIHISTQANSTNFRTVQEYQKLGAQRVVLARELSTDEISEIKRKTAGSVEIEAFVHGAMCISYSGRCLLSNYMTSRDSNRGECSQPCRFEYLLMESGRKNETYPVFEDERGTYIFNSKDLCLVNHIGELVDCGIDSFKIEGRMKTPFYVASAVKTYREAIDDYFHDAELYMSKRDYYLEQLSKTSHRKFTTGFYFNKATKNDQIYESGSYVRDYDFVGIVKSYDEQTGLAEVEQRSKFETGDEIEFLISRGKNFIQTVKEMSNDKNEPIHSAPHAQQTVHIKADKPVKEFDMIITKTKIQ